MDAGARRGWNKLPLLALPSLLVAVVLVGCTSSASPASADQHTAPVPATTGTARPSAVIVDGPNPSNAATSVASSSSAELTGHSCDTAAARAIGVAAALLPDGTSRKPEHTKTCLDGKPLDVTFPATGKLTWTVKVTVTAGTAADCQAGAEGASQRCEPIEGHPGVIGTEAICSAISCDQAWVFGGGYLTVVLGYVPGGRIGVSQPAVPDFNGLGTAIGVGVLTSLTG